MNYGLTKTLENFQRSDLLVVGLLGNSLDDDLPLTTKQLSQIKTLSKQISKTSQNRLLYNEDGKGILAVQCGNVSEYDILTLKNILQTIFAHQEVEQALTVHIFLPVIKGLSDNEMAHQCIIQTDFHLYQFKHFKTNRKEHPERSDKTVRFHLRIDDNNIVDKAQALCKGIRLTRDLANYPANICTPAFLSASSRDLSTQYDHVECNVMGKKEIEDMNMDLFLSVSKGSAIEPQLIELKYSNGGNHAPIVLVGKGITFDSGGYSIKPRNAMDEMKYDMCGAATVIGVIKAIAEAKLPVNVFGVIAATENLVSSEATKPGDIFTSMSGQTVEVTNTDAEGRLILADALTYVERFNPDFVIDIATLTGAIVVSLGSVYTGIFSQDDKLAEDILTASHQTQDMCWRMPLHQEYADILSSPIADMANASWDRGAGAITAAWFLSNYTKNYRWAHCDIAGTAYQSGKNRDATGRPVSMLFKLIQNQVHK